ncbi:polysaccharide biosynthesis/export family protein [Thalassoglobus sp.]|uniref:polysaccharide biosynthesis/export family protein n=1 Tax=Thalassoglobus sp. TaxID=2795869 RepID=UPI003AA89454
MSSLMATQQRQLFGVICLSVALLNGCSLCDNLQAVPANRVPEEFLGRGKEQMQDISLSRLRQDQVDAYRLASGDVLGVYIENVLGTPDASPPVHFPTEGNQAPALGFPIPVREDGTVDLPYVDAIPVNDLTVVEATNLIREVYAKNQILESEQAKVIVTLMRRREIQVTVIREESGGAEGVSKRGTGTTVELPAYENDVMHALNLTGGLPGTDALNEVFIIRGTFEDGYQRDQMIAAIKNCKAECECPPAIPDGPTITRIPLRFYSEKIPQFKEEDIILEEGDIVYIPARDQERYYTGGLLNGGEQLLPRDYDLDVVEAVALAGGTFASGGTGIGGISQGGGFGGGGGSGRSVGKSPSDLIVLRRLECGGQIPIRVDLNEALQNPSQRILVQPGDTLILRYTLAEELYNAAISVIGFNFLLDQVQNGSSF